MKPPMTSIADLVALEPLLTMVIPAAYEDENGHMNVRHYASIFDDAGYPLMARFGLTPHFHTAHTTGGFDLEQHLHYLNEVTIGDTVTIYFRVVGSSAKRVHYLLFMMNDTRGLLAAQFECVNSFADLHVRKTAAYPPDIAARIASVVAQHAQLTWAAPVCGIMHA